VIASLCVEFEDKILIFAVLEWWLLQWRENDASFCFYNLLVCMHTLPENGSLATAAVPLPTVLFWLIKVWA